MKHYLSSLSDDEITELFRYVFEFEQGKIELKKRALNEITFLEEWGNGTEDDPFTFLETNYFFWDSGFRFDSADVKVGYEHKKRFHQWMFRKFGVQYAFDLLYIETGYELE